MSVCPVEPTPFLSPLLQVMILVTPMMLPLNLFGLRLPEVCGEWLFDGKFYFTRDHMQGNFIPKNLKLPQPLNLRQRVLQRHLQVVSMCSCSAV